MKGRTNSVSRQDVLLNGMAQGSIDQNEVMKPSLSLHQADVYYVGKVGHVGVDFNATYYAVKNRRNDEGFEISKELNRFLQKTIIIFMINTLMETPMTIPNTSKTSELY